MVILFASTDANTIPVSFADSKTVRKRYYSQWKRFLLVLVLVLVLNAMGALLCWFFVVRSYKCSKVAHIFAVISKTRDKAPLLFRQIISVPAHLI